jgi:hypothetical protein
MARFLLFASPLFSDFHFFLHNFQFVQMEKPTTKTKTTSTILEIRTPIRNEVRCCVATKIMSMIFQLPTMSSRKIDQKLDDMFHGTSDLMSHVDIVVNGHTPYDRMFEKSVDVVITDGVSNPSVLKVNRSLFLLDRDYVVGRHLTKASLENKTANPLAGLVRGRSLHRLAKISMANMKKAYAFLLLLPEVDDVTCDGVVYKSGIGEDEVKLKLLDQMYIELNGKDDILLIDDEDDSPLPPECVEVNDTQASKTRPPGWFFPGWFAFCLYGPFVHAFDRISIFEKGSNVKDNLKVNGRAMKRVSEKKDADIIRINDDKHDRGMSISSKIGIATIEMKHKGLIQQKKEGNMIALNCRIQSVQKNIDRAEDRANRHCPEYDGSNPLWKKVVELETELTFLESQLQKLIEVETIVIDGDDENGSNILNKYVVFDSSTPKRSKISTTSCSVSIVNDTISGSTYDTSPK